PFLTSLIHNPNHIGCHTLGTSESFFQGTQSIERELLELCATKILNGEPGKFDGYVASGGTEANLQAIWMYRNFFMQEYGVGVDQITIICSEDRHYSIDKAANVLQLNLTKVKVNPQTRQIDAGSLQDIINQKQQAGVNHFIVVANMMTTMFGSVDLPDIYVSALENAGVHYKLHIDGAYGGFFYPFTEAADKLDFSNSKISSVTLDAHKMVQAPYGTGIFIVRKGLIQYTNTKEASYVEGEDYTLIGSRSGANAIAVWMILMTYGRFGWEEKIMILLKRTSWLTLQLDQIGVRYYRNPFSNIVTMVANGMPENIVKKYGLVPDNHRAPAWYKIVVMEHVSIDTLLTFINDLKQTIGS
ncbi:MAG: pyridoxal phosphate-dependent decarboxylase family protein, partial [Cyclobacteriaceae bacterium]